MECGSNRKSTKVFFKVLVTSILHSRLQVLTRRFGSNNLWNLDVATLGSPSLQFPQSLFLDDAFKELGKHNSKCKCKALQKSLRPCPLKFSFIVFLWWHKTLVTCRLNGLENTKIFLNRSNLVKSLEGVEITETLVFLEQS